MDRRDGCRRALPLCLWVWVVACAVLDYASAATSVSFPGAIDRCPNAEDRQFVVVVPSREPLGLRLSDKLAIREFVADSQGRSRAVEASGLAEIGDRLISVNNVTLAGLTFQDALSEIAHAAIPKELRFQTYDGRCITTSSLPATSSTTGNNSSAIMDVVVLSLGPKDSDRSFYALRSADGSPPGCLFRDALVASPPDACSPLQGNVVGKYVIVPDILGCPTHQKAALAQEAGAEGVVFVQRHGEKPQQIRVPTDLPTPITLPLVMVSFDSGWQLVDMIVTQALPNQSPQLRYVFSEECASERYAIHPDDDPLQRSVANRINSAGAGYLSLTVAESGSNTLEAAAFEFLRPLPLDPNVNVPALPLGRQPLFLRATSSVLNACELRPDYQLPQLAFWASEIESAFVAIELNPTACSIATQVEFFASHKALGVVFADASFPSTANLESTRQAAQQAIIPFVIVSSNAMATMRDYGQNDQANHILVEFTGENALRHQWTDLGLLQEVGNWPTTERARERLFYRMLKDQDALASEAGDHALLVKHERREALEVSFANVQRYYEQRQPRRALKEDTENDHSDGLAKEHIT